MPVHCVKNLVVTQESKEVCSLNNAGISIAAVLFTCKRNGANSSVDPYMKANRASPSTVCLSLNLHLSVLACSFTAVYASSLSEEEVYILRL